MIILDGLEGDTIPEKEPPNIIIHIGLCVSSYWAKIILLPSLIVTMRVEYTILFWPPKALYG